MLSPFLWPHCSHAFHTGCAAHMVVEHPGPPCPACRQPWQPSSDLLFQAQCQHQGVTLPARLACFDTRPALPAPPPAPTNVLPLCCHRVILANPNHPDRDDAWSELPDRQMEWAPNHNQANDTWEAEWICLRCNRSITLDHPLLQQLPERPACEQHGPRGLAVDLTREERGWVCQTRSGDLHQCQPQQVPNQCHGPRQQPRPTHGQPRLQHPDFSSHKTTGTTEGHQTAPRAQPTAVSMFHCSWQPQAGSRHTLCNNGQITLQQVTFGSVSSPHCNEPIPSHGSNFTTS